MRDDTKRMVRYVCGCGHEVVIPYLVDVAYGDHKCPMCGRYFAGPSEDYEAPEGSIMVWNEESVDNSIAIAKRLLAMLQRSTDRDKAKAAGVIVLKDED